MTTEITGISSMATREILAALAGRHAEKTGVRASIQPMGGVDAARRVRDGEALDIVVLAAPVMAQLEAEGHVLAGSVTAFARSGMAIAVPAGAPRPDIADADAVRRAVAAARTVGYSTGPSGDHLLKLCERWGLPTTPDRLVKAPPGVPVATLVAQGEADLGFQQLSELLNVPGIDVVGPLPPDIQATTVFAAGVSRTSQQAAATRAFIAYLASPETEDVKRGQGMAAA